MGRPVPDTDASPRKSRYEITVSLISALAWPAIALFLLFLYREPLHAVAIQLPSLMANSNTITVAGVSVQVDRRLRSQASTEALKSMSSLSAEGVRTLMDLTRGQPIYTADDMRSGRVDREYGELFKAGQAELIPWDETKFGAGAKSVRVTEQGRRTQELAFLIIADFAGQIAAAASAPDSAKK
jgi:hypothetical protein